MHFRRGAVLAADALGLVHRHQARGLVLGNGSGRADGGARGVGAVLARAAPEGPLHALVATCLLVEGDQDAGGAVQVHRALVRAGGRVAVLLERRRQVVPAFAGHLAAAACAAARGVEQYGFVTHHSTPP